VTEERSPLEAALDLFVFAPVGMFLTLAEDLPKLVERGKGHVESQLTMARVMGEMAAPQLKVEATKLVKGLMDRVATPAPAPKPARPRSEPPKASSPAPMPPVSGRGPASPAPPATAPAAGPGLASPESLAIPGYDSLSAMQVVQRLAGLKQPELEAVRGYEEGHRRRKTIINRADQLLAEAG
jgi:hypothetical protein